MTNYTQSARNYAEAKRALDSAELACTILYATLYRDHRETQGAKKITEEAMKMQIVLNPEWIRAKKKIIDLKHEVTLTLATLIWYQETLAQTEKARMAPFEQQP